EEVGADQDFFRLGGDSILAISLLSALREAGLHVTATQIFTHSTVRELAAVAGRATVSTVDHDDIATGPVVGSPIVQWLGETTDAIDGFVQSVVLNTPAELTGDALDEILSALLSRHDMLRARLVRGERWSFDIPETGTARWQESDQPLDQCVTLATEGLDPDNGVMLRAVWRREARQLVVAIHHVVIDGVSWRILMDDMATAWQRRKPPPVGTSFRRWTQLLERAASELSPRKWHFRRESSDYFQSALPGEDELLGRRALSEVDTVANERLRSVSVDPKVTAALLGEIPAKFHAGVNDVLLTALAVTLARWRRDLGQDQTFAHIELEGHGREAGFVSGAAGFEPDLSRTVGWFTTLFPVAVDPGAAPDFTAPDYLSAALKAVKEDLARVPDNGVSYGILRYLAGATFDAPAPQVLFNYLGRFDAGASGDWQLASTAGQLGEKRDPRMRLPRALEFNAIAETGSSGEYELVTTISWPGGVFTDGDIATIGEYFRETLTALAALEEGGHSPSDFPLVSLTQADVDSLDDPDDILPLTPLQEGLYFHSIFDDDSAGSYVEQQLLTLEGDVDADRLAQAATRLFTLYPNLAARFVPLADGRVVSVISGGAEAPFTTLDIAGVREYAEQDRLAGFDLSTGPLMRFTLIRTGPARHVLVQTVHHIIADGWSVPPMLRALLAEYHAPGTVRPRGGFADYVRWLAERDDAESDRVWREELAGLSGPSLVADGHVPSGRFAETTAKLEAVCGVPLSVVVHSAWAMTLGGILQSQDVVFGSTVSGRDADVPGIEDTVGLFINTIPVRARWTSTTTASDLLASVAAHQSAVLPHQHVSLSKIGGSLFDTLVVFDIASDVDSLSQTDHEFTITDVVNEGAPHYPLTLVVEQGLVKLIYDTELLRAPGAQSILDTFTRNLTRLLTPDNLVYARPQVAPATLGALFDTAANRDPDATAVTECRLDGSTRSLTYGELADAKNDLAAVLRAAGAGPGNRVAVAMPRSAEQVVALVAIVTVGAAYVPLDPAYPDER
ncbi:MAG TPA: condensation domain-containing protein, partial [Amycolatopsis sp.]|nr:condensation domain-containing protein [Amycolatopsis sp.]